MDKIQTTLPTAPSGANPPEVPLGISATITETPIQQNIPRKPLNLTDPSKLIYYGKFSINKSRETGSKLFSWNFRTPLPDYYAMQWLLTQASTLSQNIPWALWRAYFSRQCKIEWELIFEPVKAKDCRFSMDAVFSYDEKTIDDSLTSTTLFNDSIHMVMDDPDQQFTILVPAYWMTATTPTDKIVLFYLEKEEVPNYELLDPAFLPTTNVTLYLRAPYTPNLVQPDEIDVLVYVRPIVTQITGNVCKTIIGDYSKFDGNGSKVPVTPWFMPKVNIQ